MDCPKLCYFVVKLKAELVFVKLFMIEQKRVLKVKSINLFVC
jgi:hypothetical protein